MSNIETCKKCEIERTKETTTKYPEGLDWLSRAILEKSTELRASEDKYLHEGIGNSDGEIPGCKL